MAKTRKLLEFALEVAFKKLQRDSDMTSLEYILAEPGQEDKIKRVQAIVQILAQFECKADKQQEEIRNSFTDQADDETFVRRFLILGTTGGKFYVSEREMAMQAATILCAIIDRGNGLMLIREIVKISLDGRAPRQNPVLFALALCARYKVCDLTKKETVPLNKQDTTATNEDTVRMKKEDGTVGGTLDTVPSTKVTEINKRDRAEANDDFRRFFSAKPMDPAYQKALQQLAFLTLPKVCHTPTHLFNFIKYCTLISSKTGTTVNRKGWGRALRDAVSDWYFNQNPERLAMLVTKYRNRVGYSHRDLFRLSHIHPSPSLPADHEYWKHYVEYDAIFKYIVEGNERQRKRRQRLLERYEKKRKLESAESKEATATEQSTEEEEEKEMVKKMAKLQLDKEKKARLMEEMRSKDAPTVETSKALQFLQDFDQLRKLTANDVARAVELIRKHSFEREHVPTNMLNSKDIWKAWLVEMPMTEMINYLGKMTAVGLLNSGNEYVEMVVAKLTNEKVLKEARVHPLTILLAKTTYSSGSTSRKKVRKWVPNPAIEDALEKAFYTSFHNVTSTNKRYCLALDISVRMDAHVIGSALTCKEAAAALMMTFLRTESQVTTVAFSGCMVQFELNAGMNLHEVLNATEDIDSGRTDCAAPVIWAASHRYPFDVFIVYMASGTGLGETSPCSALRQYRQKMGILDAKLIVMGMAAKKLSVAQPSNLYMLDICGLDSSVPKLIEEFVSGNLTP